MADRFETPGWDWFETPDAGDPTPDDLAPEDLARLFARTFTGPDGRRVLAALERMTLGRALGPEAAAEELRDLEGQRRLVRLIRTLTERGDHD